ncbi:MAG: hypothetical protein JWQ98_2247 [Chlorobi bacterium]|nr:hypothetical protein [Chlorobiota bacterium]
MAIQFAQMPTSMPPTTRLPGNIIVTIPIRNTGNSQSATITITLDPANNIMFESLTGRSRTYSRAVTVPNGEKTFQETLSLVQGNGGPVMAARLDISIVGENSSTALALGIIP